MKRSLLGLTLGCVLLAAAPARAHDAYDDSQSHPLRILAYAIHPVGFALEWLVTRPIHFAVSNPNTERVFGHVPHQSPFGGYDAYQEPH